MGERRPLRLVCPLPVSSALRREGKAPSDFTPGVVSLCRWNPYRREIAHEVFM